MPVECTKFYPWDDKLPHNGRGQYHVTVFFKFAPNYTFGIGKARHFKFHVLIDT